MEGAPLPVVHQLLEALLLQKRRSQQKRKKRRKSRMKIWASGYSIRSVRIRQCGVMHYQTLIGLRRRGNLMTAQMCLNIEFGRTQRPLYPWTMGIHTRSSVNAKPILVKMHNSS